MKTRTIFLALTGTGLLALSLLAFAQAGGQQPQFLGKTINSVVAPITSAQSHRWLPRTVGNHARAARTVRIAQKPTRITKSQVIRIPRRTFPECGVLTASPMRSRKLRR